MWKFAKTLLDHLSVRALLAIRVCIQKTDAQILTSASRVTFVLVITKYVKTMMVVTYVTASGDINLIPLLAQVGLLISSLIQLNSS